MAAPLTFATTGFGHSSRNQNIVAIRRASFKFSS
jgi:hypothetical protein